MQRMLMLQKTATLVYLFYTAQLHLTIGTLVGRSLALAVRVLTRSSTLCSALCPSLPPRRRCSWYLETLSRPRLLAASMSEHSYLSALGSQGRRTDNSITHYARITSYYLYVYRLIHRYSTFLGLATTPHLLRRALSGHALVLPPTSDCTHRPYASCRPTHATICRTLRFAVCTCADADDSKFRTADEATY